MSASNDDFLFAQEAQALGYVTEAQVEEAFRLQRIMAQDLKIDERLEGILLKRGWLAEDQARRVRARIEPEGSKNEIEGYRLLERIGRGAMGTVYKALHLGLQRHVAIKVLHQDLAADSTQVERLKSEAKLLASLDHPNILRALDAGESNGFPFVVTEFVEGETLRERLGREGPLPEGEALEITRALADALERARRMGVVHRDVKPGNVLLTRQGAPKLMDLGLAKGPVDTGLTQHGATVGTPQYISPEQAQDPRKADTRSDIYSLGATLYALVTGRPPHEGSTLAEVLTKVLYETPTPPRVLNAKVSAETGYLIERMMLKDPSLRYHTPAEVVADIDQILAGRSIMPAGFRGNWEAFLLRKRIRRWATIGVAGVVVVAALVWGVAHVLRKQAEARDLATAAAQVDDLLPTVAWGPQDTRESVETKRDQVRELLGRVGGFDLPQVARLRAVGQELDTLDECMDRWYALLGGPGEPRPGDWGGVVVELLAEGNFKAAHRRVESFQRDIAPPGDRNPVQLELEQQRASIVTASLEAWRALERGLRDGTSANLDAWVERFAEFERRASRGFIEVPEVLDGVQRAKRLHAAARGVREAVLAHEAAFEPVDLDRRLRAGVAGRLLAEDLPRSERVLEDLVVRTWAGEATDVTPHTDLLGERGLVRLRVVALSVRVRAQVEAYALEVFRDADLARREGRLPDAEAKLSDLQHRLWLMGEPALYQRAVTALEQIQLERRRRQEGQEKGLGVVIARVQAALQRLDADTPAALVTAATADAELRHAVGARIEEVEALQPLGAAVERLYDRAMDGLRMQHESRKRLPVRLRGGPPADRPWLITGVDLAARTFESQGAGSSAREPRRRSLFDLEPAQIVELARAGPVAPTDRLALALGGVAVLPSFEAAQSGDARAALSAYAAAIDALLAAHGPPLLVRSMQQARAALEQDVYKREVTASGYEDNVRIYLQQERYADAYYYVIQLLNDPRLRGSAHVSDPKNHARILAMLAQIEKKIAVDSMERVLPGVRARRLQADVWELLYDFDTDLQIGPVNFTSGYGVLEPVEGPVVTPDRTRLQQRLHLLRGFEEPVKDLPLAWPSIFDPADPITVELDVFASERPYVLAIDVDGVQVAILSLDPRWLPQFRMDPDAPLLEGEKRLPEVDGFGRGRGVAFHEGADFGDLQAWKAPGGGSAWPLLGRGPRLAAEAPKPPAGETFGFPPRGPMAPVSWRVKVVREWKRLSLYVDDVLIVAEEREEWGRRGTHSERQPRMGNGSGAIRILTWTPLAIDNLKVTGTVRRAWLEARRAEPAKPASAPVPAPAAPAKPR
jgi:serine/threonine-protein kinase